MWPLVLLPCGDKVRPLLLSSAAALPSLSVGERGISGLASSSDAGMECGHCYFARRPRSFPFIFAHEKSKQNFGRGSPPRRASDSKAVPSSFEQGGVPRRERTFREKDQREQGDTHVARRLARRFVASLVASSPRSSRRQRRHREGVDAAGEGVATAALALRGRRRHHVDDDDRPVWEGTATATRTLDPSGRGRQRRRQRRGGHRKDADAVGEGRASVTPLSGR